VVEGDRLDQRLGVIGGLGEPVDARLQHLVEQHDEVVVEVLGGLLEQGAELG
jgi:hypothetical protein